MNPFPISLNPQQQKYTHKYKLTIIHTPTIESNHKHTLQKQQKTYTNRAVPHAVLARNRVRGPLDCPIQ